MAEVFLDTAYAIALSALSDQHHQRAIELAEQMETSKTRLITTRAVVLEIGNALSKARYRMAALLYWKLSNTIRMWRLFRSPKNYTSVRSSFTGVVQIKNGD